MYTIYTPNTPLNTLYTLYIRPKYTTACSRYMRFGSDTKANILLCYVNPSSFTSLVMFAIARVGMVRTSRPPLYYSVCGAKYVYSYTEK